MVYIIHFDEPFKGTQHYIGFAESDLEARMKRHLSGQGAKLLKAVNLAGIKCGMLLRFMKKVAEHSKGH